MLIDALVYGLSEESYWEMSLSDIKSYFKKLNEKQLNETRIAASLQYTHADLIGASVSRLVSKSAKFPPLEKAYPSLFEPVMSEMEIQKQNRRTELSIARMKAYAEKHNARRQRLKQGD